MDNVNLVKQIFHCDRILSVENSSLVSGALVVGHDGKVISIIAPYNHQEFTPHIQKHGIAYTRINNGILMPGIVDSHVHVNSPGRSDWEDYPCATRAAAAGGVTTIVDMPLNSLPPTTTVENLKIKTDVARDEVFVDVAFWGGVIPGNQGELLKMIEMGVVGFKCFLCPSGVDEFPNVERNDLEEALKVLQNTKSVLAFHAECELNSKHEETEPQTYSTYLKSRSNEMENKALKLIESLASAYSARYHIVHASALSGVEIIEEMKKKKINITAETCPHYLTIAAEEIPDRATQYKCAPPIRSMQNRDGLWEFIKNGVIDMIVSDHSPCTPALKTHNFMTSWGGISSLQFGLSLIWTYGSERGLTLANISKLMSANPAELCGLNDIKGDLKPKLDADFIIFDPDKEFVVTKDIIHHKNKLTPYLGKTLRGKVLQTYVRGQLVYDEGAFSERPQGKLLIK